MNKTMGTLKVDFAGTREEAREFVKDHKHLQVGNKPNVGNEGLPQLTARYASPKMRLQLIDYLCSLGWLGCVLDVPANP